MHGSDKSVIIVQCRRFGFAAVTITALLLDGASLLVRGASCAIAGSGWRAVSKSAQGSRFCLASLCGVLRNVNAAGSSFVVTSSHASGIATAAPGRARGQNDATAVAPNPLRDRSIRIRP